MVLADVVTILLVTVSRVDAFTASGEGLRPGDSKASAVSFCSVNDEPTNDSMGKRDDDESRAPC